MATQAFGCGGSPASSGAKPEDGASPQSDGGSPEESAEGGSSGGGSSGGGSSGGGSSGGGSSGSSGGGSTTMDSGSTQRDGGATSAAEGGSPGSSKGAFGLAVSGNKLVSTATGATLQLVGTNMSGFEGVNDGRWAGMGGLTTAQWTSLKAAWSADGQVINIVRLPLNAITWLNLPCVDAGSGSASSVYGTAVGGLYQPDPSHIYQAAVEQAVASATAAGLYVSLDLHWDAPNNASGQPMCPVGQPSYASEDHAPAFWTSIANEFKANPAVLFELFNEPFGDNVFGNAVSGSSPGPDATTMANGGPWPHPFLMQDNANGNAIFTTGAPNPVNIAGEKSLITTIRATQATNVILASAVWYAGQIQTWLATYVTNGNPDPIGQLAAAWHDYGYNDGPAGPLAVLAAGYPIVMTETYGFDAALNGAANASGYTWAASNHIGYLWWGLNNWGGLAAPALFTELSKQLPWIDGTAP